MNPLAEVAEAQATAAQVVEDKCQLGPDDVIKGYGWKEPDPTKQVTIGPDGKISYPPVGDIKVAGKTVKQVQYVVGKVNKLGEFVVERPANVMQALAMAGGPTPFASPSKIVILSRVSGIEQTLPFAASPYPRETSWSKTSPCFQGTWWWCPEGS